MDKPCIAKYLVSMQPLPTGLSARGNLKQSIACILFDVYGTLFISAGGRMPPRDRLVRDLLDRFGSALTPETLFKNLSREIEEIHNRLRGQGVAFPEVEIDQVWKQVLELDDLEPARRFALEFEMIVNPVCPMPHLVPMLEACRERQLSLGLISNAQFYTPLLFEWFLGADLTSLGFRSDLIFLSYRLGYAKPSLKLFECARTRLDRMGVAPQSVLYVGNDMLNDMYPATQAGFATALFGGDARSLRLRAEDPRCRSLSPDLIITDLLQLFDHL